MRARLGLTLGLAIAPLTAFAQADVSQFTLDNGMQVVVIEDPNSPAVTHMVWYRAGAADEPRWTRRCGAFVGTLDVQQHG